MSVKKGGEKRDDERTQQRADEDALQGERHGGASDAAGHCGWVLLQGVPGREPCALRWL